LNTTQEIYSYCFLIVGEVCLLYDVNPLAIQTDLKFLDIQQARKAAMWISYKIAFDNLQILGSFYNRAPQTISRTFNEFDIYLSQKHNKLEFEALNRIYYDVKAKFKHVSAICSGFEL